MEARDCCFWNKRKYVFSNNASSFMLWFHVISLWSNIFFMRIRLFHMHFYYYFVGSNFIVDGSTRMILLKQAEICFLNNALSFKLCFHVIPLRSNFFLYTKRLLSLHFYHYLVGSNFIVDGSTRLILLKLVRKIPFFILKETNHCLVGWIL